MLMARMLTFSMPPPRDPTRLKGLKLEYGVFYSVVEICFWYCEEAETDRGVILESHI